MGKLLVWQIFSLLITEDLEYPPTRFSLCEGAHALIGNSHLKCEL